MQSVNETSSNSLGLREGTVVRQDTTSTESWVTTALVYNGSRALRTSDYFKFNPATGAATLTRLISPNVTIGTATNGTVITSGAVGVLYLKLPAAAPADQWRVMRTGADFATTNTVSWISLHDQFLTSGGITQQHTGSQNYASTNDFVFGSPTLSRTVGFDNRFCFDKTNASFRAGATSGTQWDTRGTNSTALGYNCSATGNNTVSLGTTNSCTANGSVTIGYNNTSSGQYAVALGSTNTTSGESATALGAGHTASGQASLALNNGCTASALNVISAGNASTASHNYSFVWSDVTPRTSSTTSEVTFGATNGFRIYGPTTISTTLGVTGATTLSSTAAITGATTCSSTLAVTGATTLSSTAAITGATTCSSTLAVTGAVTCSSTLAVTAATTCSSTLAVTGATTCSSTLAVTGTHAATGLITANAGISIPPGNGIQLLCGSTSAPSTDAAHIVIGRSSSQNFGLYIGGAGSPTAFYHNIALSSNIHIDAATGGSIIFGYTGNAVIAHFGVTRAGTDNVYDLGTGAYRWKEVFAVATAINGSDIRMKCDFRPIDRVELRVGNKLLKNLQAHKWKEAVALKGAKARTHFGLIAQQVDEIFKEENLEARDYGIYTEDHVWKSDYKHIDHVTPTKDTPGAYEDINYGLRYAEAHNLMLSALAEQVRVLTERVRVLESR